MKITRKPLVLGGIMLAWLSFCGFTVVAPLSAQQPSTRHVPDPDRELKLLLQQGQDALDQKNYQAAASAYQKYLEKRPDDAYGHFQLGYAYTALGRRADAREEYGKAATLNPRMAEAQMNYGLALLEENPSAAIEPLRTSAALQPAEPRPRFLLGWALERSNQPAAAIAEYRQAEKLGAKDFDIHFALARTLLASNQAADAEPEFRAALVLKPDSPPAHLGLGESLIAQKKMEPAASELAEYLKSQPDDAQTRIQHASVLADLGKNDDALVELDRAGPAAAKSLPALKLRSEMLLQLKNYPQAAQALQSAITLEPQNAALHAQLGHAFLKMKNYPDASRELAVALHIAPGDSDALRDWISASYLAGNYDAALAGLDQLEKQEKSTDAIWFLRAECYDKLGKKPQALEAYQKFLAIHLGTNDDEYFAATERVRELSRGAKRK